MNFIQKSSLCLLVGLLFISFSSFGQTTQGSVNSVKINAADVPDAVKAAQSSYFPNIVVEQWTKGTLTTTQGEVFSEYVAWYPHNNKQLAKAHYHKDGKGKYSNVYYGAPGTPQAVKQGALKLYPNFNLVLTAYVRMLNSGKEAYKVSLQKGTQKVELWLDANGNEISPSYLGEGLKELWGLD